MKHITFERIMLVIIVAGVWTIAGLYFYEFINTKYVYAGVDEPVKVKVINEVDVNVVDY